MTTIPSQLAFARSLVAAGAAPDSFHVVDLACLDQRMELWCQQLPDVQPFYALKANPDPHIIARLQQLGAGFDCASPGEIAAVAAHQLEAIKILFAHPRKSEAAIRYAAALGIDALVFDSREELDKILVHHPTPRLILRLRTDDSASKVRLSSKFGASLDEAKELIDFLFSLRPLSPLAGISFHTGSNTLAPAAYARAIADAGEIFSYTNFRYNYTPALLDLGGGWVGEDDSLFAAAAAACRSALAAHIPAPTRIIAEPGRFFAAATTLFAMKILGKKSSAPGEKIQRSYYMADGAYGSFLTAITYQHDAHLLAHEGFRFAPLFPAAAECPLFLSRLWGPTCDSYDRIVDLMLADLASGSYLYTANAGAYTAATRTQFNGIAPSQAFYLSPAPTPSSSPAF